MEDTLEDWFRREILPHEAALERFLRRTRASPTEVQDIRHDIYVRVLDAAEEERPTSPKAFLFSVARHLLIDRVRRERIVSMDLFADLDGMNLLIDELTPERQAAGREQLKRLAELLERLPARCREVVWMRRVEDLPQKEIARRLGIAEATVEKHLMRGIRLLAESLYGAAGSKARPDVHGTELERQYEK